MPLHNRVDPFGILHAVAARGLFTGNRGILHDPDTKSPTGRRWTTTAWIVCACDFGGRRRDVWGRNGRQGGAGWTELFFMDEVTALAAGHRPCFFCRRADALAFRDAFAEGNQLRAVTAPQMDACLHGERWLSARGEPIAVDDIDHLPEGVMIRAGGAAYARRKDGWLRWSFDSYDPAKPEGQVHLITPLSTVAALRTGFRPVWCDQADVSACATSSTTA